MTDRRRRRRRRKNGCAFALIAVVILCAGAAAGIPWAVETFGGEVTEAFHENVEKAVHVLETETAAEPEAAVPETEVSGGFYYQQLDEEERLIYREMLCGLRETEETIRLYEKYIPSNNPVLNAILAEKALFCERHQVTLSCAVGDVDLSFLSVPDLSILLGNAIDNAVEGAARLADPGDRVVSLSIQRRYAFLSIQTNNRCLQTPELHGGLPRTTKAPGGLHGYGLKSIRYIAAKYGGNAQISVADRIFTLQIMLPIPSEKLADITKKQADF